MSPLLLYAYLLKGVYFTVFALADLLRVFSLAGSFKIVSQGPLRKGTDFCRVYSPLRETDYQVIPRSL